jgi:hypothetical protein
MRALLRHRPERFVATQGRCGAAATLCVAEPLAETAVGRQRHVGPTRAPGGRPLPYRNELQGADTGFHTPRWRSTDLRVCSPACILPRWCVSTEKMEPRSAKHRTGTVDQRYHRRTPSC